MVAGMIPIAAAMVGLDVEGTTYTDVATFTLASVVLVRPRITIVDELSP